MNYLILVFCLVSASSAYRFGHGHGFRQRHRPRPFHWYNPRFGYPGPFGSSSSSAAASSSSGGGYGGGSSAAAASASSGGGSSAAAAAASSSGGGGSSSSAAAASSSGGYGGSSAASAAASSASQRFNFGWGFWDDSGEDLDALTPKETCEIFIEQYSDNILRADELVGKMQEIFFNNEENVEKYKTNPTPTIFHCCHILFQDKFFPEEEDLQDYGYPLIPGGHSCKDATSDMEALLKGHNSTEVEPTVHDIEVLSVDATETQLDAF